MIPFRYRTIVEWSDEDAAFLARVPALPGCAAHGRSAEQAVREAHRAAEAMLAVLRADGDPLPPEDIAADYSGQIRLRLPRALHRSLDQAAAADGVSLNQEMVARLARGLLARESRSLWPAGRTRRARTPKSPTRKRRR